MKESTSQRLLHNAQRGRFQTLFFCLILLSLLTPVVESTHIGRILLYLLLSINLLAAILAISHQRGEVYFAGTMLLLALIASTWSTFFRDSVTSGIVSQTMADGLTFIAFAYTAGLILKDVVSAGPVTTDRIFAAICVYLLAGFAWGLLYIMVFINDPGSFEFNRELIKAGGDRDTTTLFSHFCYYSFVTMTTLGYGDIVPTSSMTRMMSWLQAVLGQLYVAVLIARLVGLHTQASQSDASDNDSDS